MISYPIVLAGGVTGLCGLWFCVGVSYERWSAKRTRNAGDKLLDVLNNNQKLWLTIDDLIFLAAVPRVRALWLLDKWEKRGMVAMQIVPVPDGLRRVVRLSGAGVTDASR